MSVGRVARDRLWRRGVTRRTPRADTDPGASASAPSRRWILGAGGLAFAAGLVALQPSARVAAPGALRVLSSVEYSVLVAVADALLPERAALGRRSAEEVADAIDRTLSAVHPADAADVRRVLRLLENGLTGLILDGRPLAFTRAGQATRRRVLERWRTSRWTLRRTAYRALAGLCHAVCWSDPATYPFVGYGGPPSGLGVIRAR